MGIRARTTHFTLGSVSARRGCFVEGESREVSMGMPLGSLWRWRDGVEAPGVAGGVKAGEMRLFGGGRPEMGTVSEERSDQDLR